MIGKEYIMIMRFSEINNLQLRRKLGMSLILGLGVQNDFPTVKYVMPFRKKRKRKVNCQIKKGDTIESVPN
ncbi:MAG TPA: hypothetical protein VFI70_00325 [Nitrososphaeraceae archaeon]|nr:hypothetical protein [Nitrososphaeraceae archaeon]